MAKNSNVTIKSYQIIYKLLDEMKELMGKMLPYKLEYQVTGEANILQLFEFGGKIKTFIAGCRVVNGSIVKSNGVRILREKRVIWEGER